MSSYPGKTRLACTHPAHHELMSLNIDVDIDTDDDVVLVFLILLH